MTLLEIYEWRLEFDPQNTDFYLKKIEDIKNGLIKNVYYNNARR